ncbi:MAG: hypothetical protein RJA37_1683 [Verrucomicrobiota bacterium]|jgi:uncharacterized protein YceK
MRLLTAALLAAAAAILSGCGTVEKRADDTLPQALPANWQGGLPGLQTPGSGFR